MTVASAETVADDWMDRYIAEALESTGTRQSRSPAPLTPVTQTEVPGPAPRSRPLVIEERSRMPARPDPRLADAPRSPAAPSPPRATAPGAFAAPPPPHATQPHGSAAPRGRQPALPAAATPRASQPTMPSSPRATAIASMIDDAIAGRDASLDDVIASLEPARAPTPVPRPETAPRIEPRQAPPSPLPRTRAPNASSLLQVSDDTVPDLFVGTDDCDDDDTAVWRIR